MNWIIENWPTLALILGFGLAILKVTVSLVDKLKKDLLEALIALKSVLDKVKEVRGEDSPDGKKITEQEARELVVISADAIVEVIDVVEVVIDIVKEKKKK